MAANGWAWIVLVAGMAIAVGGCVGEVSTGTERSSNDGSSSDSGPTGNGEGSPEIPNAGDVGDANDNDDGSGPGAATVLLPVEILGPPGTTHELTLELVESASPEQIYLQTHRLAFQDASVNPARGAKGSIRVNGGPWLDLTNETVECVAHDAQYGCLNGAYHTVRFTLDVQALGSLGPEPRFEFRFNSSDGVTVGWRVLDIDIRNAAGTSQLREGLLAFENPNDWVAPRPTDIGEGASLWNARSSLVEGPLSTALIRASCADCHARDGRDLKYFNYSNRSIVARSVFHGLTETRGSPPKRDRRRVVRDGSSFS